MIYCSGVKKKKCSLDGNNIVVNGNLIRIECIEEIEDFRLRYGISFGICIVGGLVLSPFIYKAIVYGVLLNEDIVEMIITGIIMFSAVGAYVFILWMIARSFGYSSYWKIGNSRYIYLEKTDTSNIHVTLKSLEGNTKFQ